MLNLIRDTDQLIVDVQRGMNDYLDRDGSRPPVQFHISNDYDKNPIDAQAVQAATKWKRMALEQFGMKVGEGLYPDLPRKEREIEITKKYSAVFICGIGWILKDICGKKIIHVLE